MSNGHDQLQSLCFTWCWNEKPELRYLLFTTRNNLTSQLEDRAAQIRMAQMKAMGMVKGTTDLIFFFAGRLYGLDIKTGTDKLRKEQLEFGAALVAQGGAFCEIRSLEEFKMQITNILEHGCLTIEA